MRQMNVLRFSAKEEEATLTILTLEIFNSSEREGEFLIMDSWVLLMQNNGI